MRIAVVGAGIVGLATDEPAMLDEDGGVIRTRAVIGALGDRLVADEVVEVLPPGEVRSGGAVRRHDRVVVCAGRDTATLAAGAGLELPVVTSTHTRFTYRGPADLACLQDLVAGAYGDPVPGGYAVGLGDEAATTAYVRTRLPGLDPQPVDTRTCWVTELPDGHDAFRVWEAGAAALRGRQQPLQARPGAGPPARARRASVPIRKFDGSLRPNLRIATLAG